VWQLCSIALSANARHQSIVVYIVTMADILKKNAAKSAKRTSVKPDEIYAAEDLADQLGTAIGLREQVLPVVAEAVRNRNTAFTLFIKTYEEILEATPNGYCLARADGGSCHVWQSFLHITCD
jgi:hypothetical protein